MIAGTLVHGTLVLATGNEPQKAGPIGLAVILVLCIACYFLFKPMSKHLRKVREEFPTDEAVRRADPSGDARSTDRPAGAAPNQPPDES